MTKTIFLTTVAMSLWVCSAVADDVPVRPGETKLVVDAFPLRGPVDGLEPEVLDFRYQPGLWQTCVGLPDDPYKTIVGSDGGLYYEYGKRGPEPYDNGQGSFGTRVWAELQAEGKPGPCRQSLHSPRIPIVVTEREQADWLVHQQAWSGAAGRLAGSEDASASRLSVADGRPTAAANPAPERSRCTSAARRVCSWIRPARGLSTRASRSGSSASSRAPLSP